MLTSSTSSATSLVRYASTAKDLQFGSDTRLGMLKGANKMSEMVGVTLGPRGRNVIIESPYGLPKITKDGVTVAKAISLSDPTENLGASLIKQVALKSNDEAGDGTTTSIVLATEIYKEGVKYVNRGNNPIDALRGMDKAVKAMVEYIRKHAKKVESNDDILNIAKISSNNDRSVGALVAEAMSQVGKDGCINLIEGKAMHHELEIVEGYRIDRGFLSPYFVTDTKEQKVQMNRPLVLVIDNKVTSMNPFVPILEAVLGSQRELLIIAEDVEGEALATLVLNKLRAGLKVCAVKAPGFGTHRSHILADIAAMTGGKSVTENDLIDSTDMSSEELMSFLGEVRSASVGRDECVFLGGFTEKTSDDVLAITNQLRHQISVSTSDYETEKMNERLGSLTGGVAQIKIGGSSELEVSEVKDRFEDALCATRAAVREGVVPGGGTAILFAARDGLKGVETANEDERQGVEIIRRACAIPLKRLVANSGRESSLIVDRLSTDGHWGDGYDVDSGSYCQLLEKGIIDPAKVVITALQNAASVASLLVTAEGSILKQIGGDDIGAMGGAMGGGAMY
eukprot:GHVH01001654.1.p1 GENE.GHVH01001654.1~~GHVH01001654.1.p1  ORF type:complete len:584 (+),score=96.25 GHVH01001654.1:50-1753(+)